MLKTKTDLFWNNRPKTETDIKKVNIHDLTQRDIENQFLLKHITKNSDVLEVGCGNGFLTSTLREHAKHVDAFDYAENMVAQATDIYGEKNNRFFHDNLLNPQHITKKYDIVVCVRVLINLENLEQQKTALEHLKSFVKPGGLLLLIEGFQDGFDALNALRTSTHMKTFNPAPINFYSYLKDFTDVFPSRATIVDTFHTGCFDFLTRIVYPLLDPHQENHGPSDFHEKIGELASVYNPDAMKNLARLHGWCLKFQ